MDTDVKLYFSSCIQLRTASATDMKMSVDFTLWLVALLQIVTSLDLTQLEHLCLEYLNVHSLSWRNIYD